MKVLPSTRRKSKVSPPTVGRWSTGRVLRDSVGSNAGEGVTDAAQVTVLCDNHHHHESEGFMVL